MLFGLIPNRNQTDYNRITRQMALGDPNAPSAGQQLLNRGLARTQSFNAALANSAAGSNPALAYRNAMNANVAASNEAMGQAAQLRSQEQLASLGQMNAIGNQQAQGMNNAFGGMFGTLAGVAGLGTLSDERTKTGVQDGEPEVRSMLSALAPKQYEYRNPNDRARFGEGDQLGVMAQQLARTPAGRQMLTQDEQGRLMIDPARSVGPSLASLAYLFDRLDNLERRMPGNDGTQEAKTEDTKGRDETLAMADRAIGYNPEENAARRLLEGLQSPRGLSGRGRSSRGRGRSGRAAGRPTEPVSPAPMSFDPTAGEPMSMDPGGIYDSVGGQPLMSSPDLPYTAPVAPSGQPYQAPPPAPARPVPPFALRAPITPRSVRDNARWYSRPYVR